MLKPAIKIIFLLLVLASVLDLASTNLYAAASDTENCAPKHVGEALAKGLSKSWNQGSARAWADTGDFWSMPLDANSIESLQKTLNTVVAKECEVFIADRGSFTARVTPKGQMNVLSPETIAKAKEKPADAKPSSGDHSPDIISSAGTTLGIFAPTKGEMILIMYSAKFAAGVARGSGTLAPNPFKNISRALTPEIDIEYNFGDVSVKTISGKGKLSMRQAAELAFKDLRSLGYAPSPQSAHAEQEFDGIFTPESHESFWLTPKSILRLELKKLKNGNVEVTLNETAQKH